MRMGVLFVLIPLLSFCAPVFAYDWSTNPGDGSPENPYQISEPNHLIATGSNAALLDKHFILTNDIIFDPNNNPAHVFPRALIAPDTDDTIGGFNGTRFSGTFDGQNHRIQNLTCVNASGYNLGLFGYTETISEISNLNLSNLKITGFTKSGGLIGTSRGAVSNCYTSGEVSGEYDSIGGLVGLMEYGSIVRSCFSSAVIRKSSTMNRPSSYLGGLVGYNFESYIIDSAATGNVLGDENTYTAGGLVGFNRGKIENCYASGNVSGLLAIGGLIGDHENLLKSSYATGNITCTRCGGGLIGSNSGVILNCYALGNVYALEIAGGFIGWTSYGGAAFCYSIGNVEGTAYVGGFVGAIDNHFTCINSFWNVETSGTATSLKGIGKTTEEMMMFITFGDWECSNTWVLDEGNDYPHLSWENPPGDLMARPVDTYGGGNGSELEPYQLQTSVHLDTLRCYVCDWDKHFILTQDIDMTDCDWSGQHTIGTNGIPFEGTLNGNYHDISNFTYGDAPDNYVGLFGCLSGWNQNCYISNLRIAEPNITSTAKNDVGTLVGRLSYAHLRKCFSVGGAVKGKVNVGGLVGSALGGLIKDCYSSTSVSANTNAGGLAGYLTTTNVYSCFAYGNVSSSASPGGLIAAGTYPNVLDSFWDINATGQLSSKAGTGLNTTQSKIQTSFTGWDFLGESANGQNEIWRMCADGVDYPRLSWEFARNGDFACANGIDLADLLALAEHWLMTEANNPAAFNYAADANADARINLEDLAVLSANWP